MIYSLNMVFSGWFTLKPWIYSLNMVFFAELWVNSHIAIENGQIVDLPSSKMAIVHSDVGLPEGKRKKMGNDWPCPQPANRPCLQFAGSNWQLGGWVSAIEATWLGFMYDMYWYVPKFMAHYGTFSSRAWRCFEDMMHFFMGKLAFFFWWVALVIPQLLGSNHQPEKIDMSKSHGMDVREVDWHALIAPYDISTLYLYKIV